MQEEIIGQSSENKVEENSSQSSAPIKTSFLDKVSSWILLAVTFLMPVIFYAPFTGFDQDFNKKALLFGGAILATIFWLLARFEDGKFSLPGGWVTKSWFAIVITFALSSAMLFMGDKSVSQSVFGMGYDTDTFMTLIALMLLMFLASVSFQDQKKMFNFYATVAASSLVVLVIEVYHLYGGGNFLAGNGMITNTIGRWNDLGVFFGFVSVLCLSALELLKLNLYPKVTLSLLLIGSLFMVGTVNYGFVWGAIGMISLVIFVYSLYFYGFFKSEEGVSKSKIVTLLKPSFIVIVLSVVLFFSQTKIGEYLQGRNIINLDVRPSWSATLDIAQNALKGDTKKLLFGFGPNNFVDEWIKFKPDAVNSTVFWNVDFNAGVGRLPTYLITVGLLGFLSWLVFIGFMFYYGFRAVLYEQAPKSSRFAIFTSFVGVLYLWTFFVASITDTVILVMTFLMAGVFVASLIKGQIAKKFEFSFLNDPRLGFTSVLVLILLVITNISAGYLMYKKFNANYLFQNGVYVLNTTGDLDKAESLVKSATSYDEQDIFYRTLSDINILKLRKFVGEQKAPADKAVVSKLQEFIVAASTSARKSIDLNKDGYENWMSLGKVGEAVVPLKVVDGAYGLASDSYNQALKLNPKNPMILLSLARLEVSNNDIKKAKEYLTSAIAMKSNFTAALFLMSQIEASEGNIKDAINRAEQAYLFAPNDLGVLFQLGFLKYTDKDYQGAIDSFQKATSINSQYSNAKYFLGLSYYKVGKSSAALKEFKEIATLNPDNAEVKSIIKNLTSGNDPFAPAVKAPEKSSTLPIKEN